MTDKMLSDLINLTLSKPLNRGALAREINEWLRNSVSMPNVFVEQLIAAIEQDREQMTENDLMTTLARVGITEVTKTLKAWLEVRKDFIAALKRNGVNVKELEVL